MIEQKSDNKLKKKYLKYKYKYFYLKQFNKNIEGGVKSKLFSRFTTATRTFVAATSKVGKNIMDYFALTHLNLLL